MPVIVSRTTMGNWINPEVSNFKELKPMLKQFLGAEMANLVNRTTASS